MEDELLRAALLASSAFTSIVGSGDAARLYWGELPRREAGTHCIVHEIASEPFSYHLEGRLPLLESWRQIDCWAATPKSARQLRDVLVAAAGPIAGLSAPPLQAFIRRLHGAREIIQGPAPTDRSANLFRASLDVQLWLSESV